MRRSFSYLTVAVVAAGLTALLGQAGRQGPALENVPRAAAGDRAAAVSPPRPAPGQVLDLSPEEQINVRVYQKVNRSVVNIFLGCEYGVGDYYRAFTIGEAIDADKITAELKQGVLTVHLPRVESVKPKKVAVKAE